MNKELEFRPSRSHKNEFEGDRIISTLSRTPHSLFCVEER